MNGIIDKTYKTTILSPVSRWLDCQKGQDMTKAFETRVLKEGIVDTKKYRYRLVETSTFYGIKRIEISKLDTTASYTDWETVKEF